MNSPKGVKEYFLLDDTVSLSYLKERWEKLKGYVLQDRDIKKMVRHVGIEPQQFINPDDPTELGLNYHASLFGVERSRDYYNSSNYFILKDDLIKAESHYFGAGESKIIAKQDKKEWRGKMVKISTYEKYEKWQKAVTEYYDKRPYLSHRAICTRLASTLKADTETIRKNTSLNPPESPK